MYFTGFADEAAKSIDGQIKATQALGWQHIEARNINGRQIHDIPDDEFEQVVEKLEAAGIGVNCFGSAVANWGKQITEPFESSLDEARHAIPRMQRLGTRMIRIMSFAVQEDRDPFDQMEEERFRRLRQLVHMFVDADITPVHENCMNYGGMGWQFTLKLLESVPELKLVFDTGNPVFNPDRSQLKPWPRQSSWEFYNHVKEYIAYIHIKDCFWNEEKQVAEYTFPGEGDAEIPRILTDMFHRGYDGGISIEPHLAVVFHDNSVQTSEQDMFDKYVEYGKRLEALVNDIKNRNR